ncbi:MAG: hypothetical protein D6746_00550 [Bacteroidetes bacterium]|nr:MAG: hypothetical protein D6746_00550 [Bacteroidota bacterium]
MPKLTESQTKFILDQIEASEKADRDFFRRYRVWRDYFTGDQFPVLNIGQRDVLLVANLTFATVKSLTSALMVDNVQMELEADHPEAEGTELIWESVAKKGLKFAEFDETVNAMVLDCIIAGEGWAKLTVRSNEANAPATTRTRMLKLGEVEGAVWTRESVDRVIVDYLSTDRSIEKARYIAVRYTKSADELRADGRFNIPDNIDSDVSTRVELGEDETPEFRTESGKTDGQAVEPLITFYEVWIHRLVNKKTGLDLERQVVVVAEGIDQPLYGPVSWDEFLGEGFAGWPFERLVFNEVPDKRPLSEIETWAKLQAAYNYVLSKMVNLIGRQKVVHRMDVNNVPNVAKVRKQLLSDNDMAIVETETPDAVQSGLSHTIAPDQYNFLSVLSGLIDRTSSISDNRAGTARNIRTATEAGIVDQAIQTRFAEKESKLLRVMGRMIYKWMQLTLSTMPAEVVFKMIGDTGSVEWQRVSPEDLRYLPHIEVKPETLRSTKENKLVSKWQAALNITLSAAQALGGGVRVDLVIAEALRALGIPNVREIVGNATGEEMAQVYELVRMLSGEKVEVRPEDNHKVHLQSIDAFLNTANLEELDPDVAQNILDHRNAHVEAAKAIDRSIRTAVPGSSNPFDAGLSGQVVKPASTGPQLSDLAGGSNETGVL